MPDKPRKLTFKTRRAVTVVTTPDKSKRKKKEKSDAAVDSKGAGRRKD